MAWVWPAPLTFTLTCGPSLGLPLGSTWALPMVITGAVAVTLAAAVLFLVSHGADPRASSPGGGAAGRALQLLGLPTRLMSVRALPGRAQLRKLASDTENKFAFFLSRELSDSQFH